MSTLLEHPQTLLPSSTLSLPNNQRLHWQQDILSHNFSDFNNNQQLLLTLAQDLAEKHLNQQLQETISLINQPNGLTHLPHGVTSPLKTSPKQSFSRCDRPENCQQLEGLLRIDNNDNHYRSL